MNPVTVENSPNPSNDLLQNLEQAFQLLPASRKRGSLKWLGWLFLLGVVGGGGYAAWYYWPRSTNGTSEVAGQVTKGDLVVLVTERGELDSAKSIDVRCDLEGRQAKIIEILGEGTMVKKDTVVVKFDSEEITKNLNDQQIKLRQAEGKAKVSQEKLKQAENKAKSDIEKAELALKLAKLDHEKYIDPKGEYQVQLEKSRSEIMIAKKDLEEATQQLENLRTVVKRGLGAPEQLRFKEMILDRSKFSLKSAEAALHVLENFTKVKQEAELESKSRDAASELDRTKSSGESSIIEAKSQLEADNVTANLEKRALERLEKQLNNCIVKAPQDGIIVYSKDRYWDPQAAIRSGALVYYQQTLFSLPDLSQMKIKVKVHESMIKKVQKGQPCEIVSDAIPNKVLHGKVQNVATLADSRGYWDERSVKEYVVEVSIDDLPMEAGLKPGMSAEVRINAGEYKQQLLVPVQSVTERAGKHFCYSLASSSAEKKQVEVGESNEKFIIIKSGLTQGEKIALNARKRMAEEIRIETEKAGGVSPDAPKESVPQAPAVKASPIASNPPGN